MNENTNIPEHLKRWPGLFTREGNRIVDALAEDASLAQKYPYWIDKGAVVDGRRITIMSAKSTYQVGEEIRVIHVAEVVEPDHTVYVMGPKTVYGEFVDGNLVSDPLPDGAEPLTPAGLYDGATLPSPAVDYNYEITTHTFSETGTHEVQWKIGDLESNKLMLSITD